MAFTTWLDLKNRMLNDLASGAWHVQSYQVGDQETRYKSFAEFREALDFVTAQVAEESGGAIRRTLASHPRSSG